MTSWTKAQSKVIENRGSNLLVSAAAGSGKTAVLVEHIIRRVLDEDNPADIDRLMVVTFTNAAAGEMRERIMAAIEDAVEKNPDNRHLQKQLTYIHNAKITTLHSYCLNLIRENFDKIDIDPGFRIADTGEVELLKGDIVSELLEEYYEKGDKDFLSLSDMMSKKNSDAELENTVLLLYKNACSNIDREKWLNGLAYAYSEENEENFDDKIAEMSVNEILEDALELSLRALKIAYETDGPVNYIPMLQDDYEKVRAVAEEKDLSKKIELISEIKYQALSRKKDDSSIEKKESVKKIREQMKELIKRIKNDFKCYNGTENKEIQKKIYPLVKVLSELVLEFSRRYTEKKREKTVIDFDDIEYMALQILLKKEGEQYVPTAVADELAKDIEEVIVDEYQDINQVQDAILTSLSSERFSRPDMFMVGDVKQSIYGFRKASPELFMKKYDTYGDSDNCRKIILDRNFRSRKEVIDSINFLFRKIMMKKVGGIEYDDDNALYLGADYPRLPENQEAKTELIIANVPRKIEGEHDDDGTNAGISSKEFEAKVAAERIKELVDEKTGYQVYDRKTGEYRKAQYSDILILLRSANTNAGIYMDALMAAGIPVYFQQQTGYFDAVEVKLLLCLLNVIDNPHQDIELVSVLNSVFAGLDENELAIIRSESEEKLDFYDDTKKYIEEGSSTVICEKLLDFYDKLDKYRRMATYTSIHDLLTYIIEDTGYDNYVTAMPAGERRIANIEMLKQKAIVYENGSYRGLFNFVRYIEKLKKYEIDSGEASVVSENDNLVRIMSIHKSKGLEFPIVFLCNANSSFNDMDARKQVVIHKKQGIGMDYTDYENRVRYAGCHKKSIQILLKRENREEELRILYVALTRAKEKLIITASGVNEEKYSGFEPAEKVSSSKITGASSYMDFIGYALGSEIETGNEVISVVYKNVASVIENEVKETIESSMKKENFLNWNTDFVYSEDTREILNKKLKFKYPYESAVNNYIKVSVSDLKRSKFEENNDAYDVVAIEEPEIIIPSFIRKMRGEKEKKLTGSLRGTAYHKVFELLDFITVKDEKSAKEFFDNLEKSKKMSKEELQSVRISDIVAFVNSSLGKRMKNAFENGVLHREAQFVMGTDEEDVYSIESNERVLVQGIIDAYFEEADGIVIADYKTDRIKNIKELEKRYRVQLEFYKKAVEQITGKKVKEMILYSVALNDEYSMEEKDD